MPFWVILLRMTNDNPPLDELKEAIIQSLQQELPKLNTPPDILPVFPVAKRPFFPGMAAPVVLEAGAYYELVKKMVKKDDKWVAFLLTKDEKSSPYKLEPADLYNIGVMARIIKVIPMDQGGAQLIVNMEKRIVATEFIKEGKMLRAKVDYHTDKKILSREMKAYSASITSSIKELLKLNPLFKEELQIFLNHSDLTDAGSLADFAVSMTTATREELQEMLEMLDIPARVEKALKMIRKELDLSQLQNRINKQIDSTLSKNQKEYFLKEQLKTIKKELGLEKDEKSVEIAKFEERIKDRTIPDGPKKTIQEEFDKFKLLEPHSSEFGVTRNYLDWLTSIPWGTYTTNNVELSKAKETLEADHYGLSEVKKRIVEFIAVAKLAKGMKGNIICLVGPPGVGKTSIGKSIARSLGRKFFRFSVGGMRDEAEIKGHRRTYVGAQPGKIIQALKYCQTMNPVILIDEIDKLGESFQGDPASALLEVLDKEQNNEFLDHYLDVRIDISDVLFIVTANVLDTILEPLLDRMEIIRLSGYIEEEKYEIANRYLIPKNMKEMGLKAKDVSFEEKAIKQLINGYAREAGVRSLETWIKKILRKVAVNLVEKNEKGEKVTKTKVKETDLNDLVGKPPFTSDKIYQKPPVGVATGLAWTAMGGATLYIETAQMDSDKPEMKLTGQAGDVMKESSQIAWSFLQSHINRYTVKTKFFPKSQVHIHIPEGATPKDGPSAGITMVTSLISLLMNKPVPEDLCMTGELTLTGQVLPIGGVKEKLIAAKRTGLKTVILPKENERDYAELPEQIKKDLQIHFVKHYDDVYKIAFEDLCKSGKKPIVKRSSSPKTWKEKSKPLKAKGSKSRR